MAKQKNQQQTLESYKDVSLTKEEEQQAKANAIDQAKRAKYAKMQEEQYWQRVREGDNAPKITPKQYADYVMAQADELVGGEFKLDKYREPIFNKLFLYFTGNSDFEQDGLSLNKGILLWGAVGCGKTTMLRIFAHNPKASYMITSARKVASRYATEGFEALEGFYANPTNYMNKFGHSTYGICFDDLGTEGNTKNYGNEVNPMQEVLLTRYDMGIAPTHITTNLSGEQIGEQYGERVRSRAREMFNIIAFDSKANDLRE